MLISIGLALTLSIAAPQEWPRFLGPDGTATSTATNLIDSFPEEGPPVLWRADVGFGFGGAAVRDGEVFLLDREFRSKDILRCLDLETGEEKWRFAARAVGMLQFHGSRQVPTVEERHVYIAGGFGDVHCVDRETHEAVWSTHLVRDHKGAMPGFGYALSPVVYDDLVILAPTGKDIGLLALNRFNGEVVWTTPGVGTSESTPVVRHFLGRDMVLFLSSRLGTPNASDQSFSEASAPVVPGTGYLTAVDPTSGEVLWQVTDFYCQLPIPVPVVVDERRLFLTGGYQGGSMLVEFLDTGSSEDTADGDPSSSEVTASNHGEVRTRVVFRSARGAQIHTPILHEDHLYLIVNENRNCENRRLRGEGGLMCIDLEGQEQWRTGDDPFLGRGGLLLADGKLFVQDGDNGHLHLIDPTPDGFQLISKANVFQNEARGDQRMWAPLAMTEGRLLVRSQQKLLCLDVRKN